MQRKPEKQRPPTPSFRVGSRRFPLPASRLLRIAIGTLFVLAGLVGFLPVLGFWMIPVGLVILSIDLPWARRLRRRLAVWFSRQFPGLARKLGLAGRDSSLRRRDDSA